MYPPKQIEKDVEFLRREFETILYLRIHDLTPEKKVSIATELVGLVKNKLEEYYFRDWE